MSITHELFYLLVSYTCACITENIENKSNKQRLTKRPPEDLSGDSQPSHGRRGKKIRRMNCGGQLRDELTRRHTP